MNKNISFSKLIKQSVVHKIWALFLSTLAYFFAFPIQAGVYVSTSRAQMEYNSILLEMLPRLFRYNVLGENNSIVMVVTCFLAIFMGLYCFSFVFNRTKIDLFHSIPVKRNVLFFAKYLGGFLSFIVPYVVFMFVAILLGVFNGLMTPYSIPVALYMFVMNVLMFILVYSTTILAVMLTGKLPVAILLDGVFMVFGPLLTSAIDNYSGIGFYTYYSNFTNQVLDNLSPIFLSANQTFKLVSYKSVPCFGVLPVVILLVCCVVMTLLSLFVYLKRPSEVAGRSLTFMKSLPVIEIPVLSLLALYGGLLFDDLASEYGWIFFGVIITAVIGHMAYQAIMYGDFKSIIKSPWWLGVTLALSIFVTCIFLYDLFRYDEYIPNETKLESAAFSSYDLVNGIDYYDFDGEENPYGYYEFYLDSQMYQLENMKITDKQLIIDLCRAAVEDSLYAKEMQRRGYNVESSFESERWCDLSVAYNLGYGTPVFRSYRINVDKHFDLLNALYTNKDYKETTYPILSDDIDYELSMSYRSPMGITKLSTLTASEKQRLTETYNNELGKLDLYALNENIPVGEFYFNISPAKAPETSYSIDKAYIYPCFTQTIALLEEYGIDVYEYRNVDNIESIRYREYHYSGYDDDSITMDFTSREDIERILELGFSNDYAYINSALHHYADASATISYCTDCNCDWDVILSFTPEAAECVTGCATGDGSH